MHIMVCELYFSNLQNIMNEWMNVLNYRKSEGASVIPILAFRNIFRNPANNKTIQMLSFNLPALSFF